MDVYKVETYYMYAAAGRQGTPVSTFSIVAGSPQAYPQFRL